MLYECWRKIATERASELALVETGPGRRWTFRDLLLEEEKERFAGGTLAFPTGRSCGFILTVLRAWRAGCVVCPVEPDQRAPAPAGRLPEGIVHLKTSSASTGPASSIVFTAPQLRADAGNIVGTMGLRPDWPNIGIVSLAHSYGFSNLVLPLLLHGVPLLLAESTLPESLRRAAEAAREVTLAGVPALWQAWHAAGAIPGNVRLAISAGSPLPLALESSVFQHDGLKVHNFYGSSECGGIAYDVTAQPRSDPACVGSPINGVAVSLAENGCLEVRSNAVGESYWPEPKPGLSGGVFKTGDLAELQAGFVYLRGRAGDQINVAGRKVSPESIEEVLRAHPRVRACLTFGVPGGQGPRGEIIVACVAADPGVSAESLKQFALAKLPAWQVPREWWLLEDLPPGARGKLSRAEWRRKFLERQRS
ncbi:MAG TPA: class I adenylate-forming enzyme family protein [Verrucomicrobiae bacterium]|nr:class I adenylate-forming enzyme family protein [Verrucomicrobiae bacterium]